MVEINGTEGLKHIGPWKPCKILSHSGKYTNVSTGDRKVFYFINMTLFVEKNSFFFVLFMTVWWKFDISYDAARVTQ